MCFWTLAAENQVKRIREKYLHAILRQDIGWHDTGKQSESLTTRLNSDTQLIYDGMADKVGLALSSFTTFIAGFVIGFTKGWKLSLVLLTAVPLIGACAVMMSKFTVQSTTKGQDSYSKAGSIAEQTFSSIRTIVAFGGQKRETDAYIKQLDEAFNSGKKRALAMGLGIGGFMIILFCTYALAFWFGGREVHDGKMASGEVLNVFMGMIIGAFALGNIGPNVSAFASAQGAAYSIFKTIDRVPTIDSASPLGAKPENVQGHIVVRDVDFAYPSRPDVQILKKMNFEVKPGQTVALVGHSGSGKSTIIGLVERFYDPLSGTVTLDGVEIKDWNVTYLRDTIGIVSQEPVLFNASIKQNIIYGIRKDQAVPTDKEIEEACRLSNAHDFIMKLPEKYNTMVGEKGALLSGGQKQRIAIARALIKNPRILLLDEATSALDTESERIVQAALDKAANGRSTIVIAHRLSTVMNADVIYVMDKGIVLESGTHESLLAKGGVYAELVMKQQLKSGGVDVDNVVPESVDNTSTAAPHIAIADEKVAARTSTDERRKSFSFSTKLRRMSSARSVPRSEKSLQRVDTTVSIPETPEEAEARIKREKAASIKAQKAPIMRVLKYMRPEWTLVIIGAILSGGSGAIFPAFAIFFGDMLTVLMRPTDPNFTRDVNHNALMFVVLGIAAFICNGGSIWVFEYVGEVMARRMRTRSFKAIISQEMGFFDREENSTGALSSRLATDAYQMHELISQIMKLSFQTIVTVAMGLGLAFAKSWRLTLVILACIPLIGASQYFAMGALAGFSNKSKKAYEQSGRVANEAITNIRTVVALAKESTFEEKYLNITKEPHKFALRRAWLGSFGYALSQGVAFWTYAIGFYAGYRFVIANLMVWDDLFQTMFYVIFMAMGLGQLASQAPRFFKGKESSINVFELLDKQTTIDALKDGIAPTKVDGSLGLENVDFHYPTRPDQQIFKGVNVSVRPSQTVALVGPSGCGKSTIIALLERWYDVLGGKATIDNYDVRDLQLNNIREHMALVGQEPVLFDISIGDNIRYGVPDGQTVDDEQVFAAAKAANIHNFVMSLPDKYETRVGDKGSQLSGGQKQRIAIARALIRNPKILLLDEATSALDSESEKLVQDALDRAREGRTTIVIAHRLRTIQDADLILVVKDGSIVESGRHYELISRGGLYADLCKRQNLEVTH
ncbi:P-loop containing nucleoside triphosphate hydrolase protein [Lobosporangium transversale]|uniref:p-loop containing nucleoside triphosphate hydrolase protein n=1 Tax=Lobosporangium transversale TaxID=64571 RepID=A0A1Y2H2X3_9FUNG|nr:P-loop containing nucleoside triphosphate hydrolase protein [Lobosporangium transversale]ORZ28896.1 P-loop containing nucleoside triphosphate hydrolase protein [Lobosporangium transversale]|eukprot:XP_021886569.1 P-loop containing nucleoside triphosphate hydrolase protein [Lobosporangium transversale]